MKLISSHTSTINIFLSILFSIFYSACCIAAADSEVGFENETVSAIQSENEAGLAQRIDHAALLLADASEAVQQGTKTGGDITGTYKDALKQVAESRNRAHATPLPLLNILQDALSSHPDVLQQESLVNASERGIDSARWQYFPTPNVSLQSAATSSNDPSFVGDDLVATFSLDQPIWTGGRISSGIDRAHADADSSYASLEVSRQDIMLRVIQAYGQWNTAFLQRQAWEKNVVIHRDLKKQVERRLAQGVSSKSDLFLAQGRLDSAESEVISSLSQEQVALSGLSQLVGRNLVNVAPMTELEPKSNQLREIELAQLIVNAEQVSPVIKRSQAEINVANSQISQNKSALWPDISLRFEHQIGNFNQINSGNQNRVFVNFNSQFGAGLSSLSGIEEANAQYEAALSAMETQRRLVREQVLSDYFLLNSFKQRIGALKSSLDTATKVYESYIRQFLVGRRTWFDVMNSARDLVGTEVRLVEAEATQMTVVWRLAVVVQGVDELMSGGELLSVNE